MDKRTCSVTRDGELCDEPYYAKGYCKFHYGRIRRTGSPGAGVPRQVRAPGRECSFTGCGNPHAALGYCASHWKQLRDGREPGPLRPRWNGAECAAEETCHEPVLARGYCGRHYQAWNKYGDPLHQEPRARCGNRKYTLDEHYFDEISTAEKAYWLGFIAADGGIIRTRRSFSLKIELASRDSDHLRLLSEAIGSDRPLQERRGQAIAQFDSWRLIEALERHGITPRKSSTLQPWDGPAHLMPHYWRGLFDGDGSIFQVTTTRCWSMTICGSRACVEAFAGWAKAITGSAAVPRQVHDTGCWTWAVTGGPKPQMLARELYAGAPVALARKKERGALLCAREYRKPRASAGTAAGIR